jgi:CDP-diacylglycerol--glycerol-3-phosphate 3-phosphatidyltransferase
MAHGVVPESAARAAREGMSPLARVLRAAGISANAITVIGVVLTVTGAALVALEMPLAGLATLIVGSLADTLDGLVARASGGGTKVGAFLDSTADRIADAALFTAAAWLGASRPEPVLFWAALVALSGSFLVSYVRAKAESLGARATVGPAPREARLAILLLGLAGWALFSLAPAFTFAVLVVAILASITALLRIAVVVRALASG